MDKLRFFEACRIAKTEHKRYNIGTLSEKTVHAVLKNYFEPYADSHEQKIGGFVADIVGEDGIIEIQTGNFSRLRPKLAEFLKYCAVTVVYPIAAEKHIVCFDPDTGEIFSKRKSPLHGNIYSVFDVLPPIAEFMAHPNFRLCAVIMKIEEYRVPPEKAPSYQKKKRRKGAYSAYDRLPTELVDEIHLDCPADWLELLPRGLPDSFTTADMAERGMDRGLAQLIMNVYNKAGIVRRVGKKGNSYIYSAAPDDISEEV